MDRRRRLVLASAFDMQALTANQSVSWGCECVTCHEMPPGTGAEVAEGTSEMAYLVRHASRGASLVWPRQLR